MTASKVWSLTPFLSVDGCVEENIREFICTRYSKYEAELTNNERLTTRSRYCTDSNFVFNGLNDRSTGAILLNRPLAKYHLATVKPRCTYQDVAAAAQHSDDTRILINEAHDTACAHLNHVNFYIHIINWRREVTTIMWKMFDHYQSMPLSTWDKYIEIAMYMYAGSSGERAAVSHSWSSLSSSSSSFDITLSERNLYNIRR